MLIPESGAGYSRVTHPFATDPEEQAPLSPFDLHVLSTPPAFILSQDQTLHKCLIARQQADGTSSAGISRNRHQPCKFETDKNKSILTCFVLFISFPKESLRLLHSGRRPSFHKRRGFWHLTLCTLLSSQGSGAPGFHLAASTQGLPSQIRCLRFRAGQLV